MQHLNNKCRFLFALIALLAFGTTTLPTSAEEPTMGAYYVHYDMNARSSFDATLASLDGDLMNDYAGFLDGVVSVTLPTANASALADSANVTFMEPIPVRETMAEYIPYGLNVVQARQVWDADGNDVADPNAPAGAGLLVCVIDSGIIAAHKDFAGANITGMSQITGEAWNTDGNGHGTHVSGTVGARLQGLGLPGVAPQVDIHHVKVFNNAAGVWVPGQSDLVGAVQDCLANRVNIISMSLGGGVSSTTEDAAFQAAYNSNVLSVAAAGNGGTTTGTADAFSYPASYNAVMSVASHDSSSIHAASSQENAQVEIAAPGVDVMSTYPTPNNGGIPVCEVTDSSSVYACNSLLLSSGGTATGTLVDGGLCDTADISTTWSGNIVLCERGIITFRSKVDNTEGAGAIGTIIYNNLVGNFSGTLGSGTSNFPAVSLTQADGQFLFNNMLGTTVTIVDDSVGASISGTGGYALASGTSMATPHVAGAAAVIWSACPELTSDQLRAHMTEFAINPNGRSVARDITFGWGIVKIDDAIMGLFDGIDTYTSTNDDGGTPMNAECPVDPLAVDLSGVETAGSLNLWVPFALVILMLGTAVAVRRRTA